MRWDPDANFYHPYLRARIRRRHGIGEGPSYVPWLKVRDVPSKGTSSIISGVLTGRAHHLLSELEATYFYLVERNKSTADVREQWPILDIDYTLALCRQYGVQHPFRAGHPEPFTLDFLITERSPTGLRYRASTIKTPADGIDPGVRRRLAIERDWCEVKGIPYSLVDTTEFNRTLLNGLRFARGWYRHRVTISDKKALAYCRVFAESYSRQFTMHQLIERSARDLAIDVDVSQDLFRYCIWRSYIPVDFRRPLALNLPVWTLPAAENKNDRLQTDH